MSSAPSTAPHTVAPIRPAAPATATRNRVMWSPRGRLDRAQCLLEAGLIRADPRGREPLGRPQFGGQSGQIIMGHRVDSLHHLIEREQRRTGQHLGPQTVHAGAGRLE